MADRYGKANLPQGQEDTSRSSRTRPRQNKLTGQGASFMGRRWDWVPLLCILHQNPSSGLKCPPQLLECHHLLNAQKVISPKVTTLPRGRRQHDGESRQPAGQPPGQAPGQPLGQLRGRPPGQPSGRPPLQPSEQYPGRPPGRPSGHPQGSLFSVSSPQQTACTPHPWSEAFPRSPA